MQKVRKDLYSGGWGRDYVAGATNIETERSERCFLSRPDLISKQCSLREARGERSLYYRKLSVRKD